MEKHGIETLRYRQRIHSRRYRSFCDKAPPPKSYKCKGMHGERARNGFSERFYLLSTML